MSDSESEAGEIDLRELYRDPIISRISAVGGVETIKLQDGSISQEYKLGDECLGGRLGWAAYSPLPSHQAV